MRVMENFNNVSDTAIMALLKLLTAAMDTNTGDWTATFARKACQAGFIGTVTSWLDDILLRDHRFTSTHNHTDGHSSCAQECKLSGTVFLRRLVCNLGFFQDEMDGFQALAEAPFRTLMAETEEIHTCEQAMEVIKVLAAILACALFYGDDNVCEMTGIEQWISTLLHAGVHSSQYGGKELARNMLTVHTVAVQARGHAQSEALDYVLDIVSMLSREEVICDPEIVECLWHVYGEGNPGLAAEVLSLWLEARRDPNLSAHVLANEPQMMQSVMARETSFAIIVSLMDTGTQRSKLLSLLDLIQRWHSPQVSHSLLKAGFAEAMYQILLICLDDSDQELRHMLVSTLSLVLWARMDPCPTSQDGDDNTQANSSCSAIHKNTSVQKDRKGAASTSDKSHATACTRVSKKLFQFLHDLPSAVQKDAQLTSDAVLSLAALHHAHLNHDDVIAAVLKCSSGLCVALESHSEEYVSVYPALCVFALVLCARTIDAVAHVDDADSMPAQDGRIERHGKHLNDKTTCKSNASISVTDSNIMDLDGETESEHQTLRTAYARLVRALQSCASKRLMLNGSSPVLSALGTVCASWPASKCRPLLDSVRAETCQTDDDIKDQNNPAGKRLLRSECHWHKGHAETGAKHAQQCLVVCQQALVDPAIAPSVQRTLVAPCIAMLIGSAVHPKSAASLGWNKVIAQHGLEALVAAQV
jgi:hypothetical protein